MNNNYYRFSLNVSDKDIIIPVEITFDQEGREQGVEEYESEVLERVINGVDDFEISKFAHAPWDTNNDVTQVHYQFNFFNPNTTTDFINNPPTITDWLDDYQYATFTDSEIYYFSNSFKGSFFKLDFYDSKTNENQKILFSVVLPTQQGLKEPGFIGPQFNQTTVQVKKPFPYQFQKVIADDPNVQGQLLYDDFGYPESILLKESLIDNPKQLAGTVAHEVLTGIMDDQEKAREGERRIIEQGLKPFEEGWGDLEDSDKDSAKAYYDYFTDEAQDNIQSAIFEVRVNKGLKPDQIITDEDIENWKKEAEETGAFDKKDPDYDPALYNLFKVVKDNSALKKWFNYIASTDNEMEDEDTQYAKFGGAMDYEFGDEVDLSDEEAKALMDLGYTLEMVK